MTATAVLPIKQLQNAKQRLSDVLSSSERQQLFRCMVEDVLTAVEACSEIERIVIVTDDKEVGLLGQAFDAEIRPEPHPAGLIEAVTETGLQLAREGIGRMVFLPGDVPLISADELSVVLGGFGASGEAELMIVPASDLGGTNCLACSPPDCMTYAFGHDSFRKHLAIARSRGIEPQVAKLPGAGLDIDTRDDLECLIATTGRQAHQGREYSTVRYLNESGIALRLETDKEVRNDSAN
ncbi:MAG: 2-phospho-L-lactate guanylyltransferase [Candidatus Azotimanducaceae bacterium]|jgi:2-phospho-L-lactate guanylyltransferase